MEELIMIEPGVIFIDRPDRIRPVVNHANVKIFEIELISKYPEAATMYDTETGPGVLLFAGERTLKCSAYNVEPTVITFPFALKPDGWHIMVEAERYTVRVVLWNMMIEN